jgi:hypothetical protein
VLYRVAALLFAIAFIASTPVDAQESPINSPLLDHLVGQWVLRAVVHGAPTTHDVTAQWALGHHYLEIRETSRARTAAGVPQYEARVFVARNDNLHQYAAVWLDVYGGLGSESIGYATPAPSHLRFVFRDAHGNVDFINDFVYTASTNSWEWRMFNVSHGVPTPFSIMYLTRR